MSRSLPGVWFQTLLINLKLSLSILLALAFLTEPVSIIFRLVFPGEQKAIETKYSILDVLRVHANATPMKPPTTRAITT